MHRFAFASLLLAACGSDSTDIPEVKSDLARQMSPDINEADLASVVAGNTAFASDLYGAVSASEDGNLFMSPHSISTALAMTYAGARGNTATQMETTFHFPNNVPLHAGFNAIDLALASRAAGGTSDTIPFKLRTANSIWGRDGATFLAPFLDTLAVNYGAGLHVLDFANDPDGSREVINGWVEDQTNDKIKDLLPQGSVDPNTRLVLTNAIYFSAAWAEPFEVSATADRPFQVAGNAVQVPTLRQTHGMRYSEGTNFAAAEIPYDGGQLAMTVVRPTGDLSTIEQDFAGVLAQIDTNLQFAEVSLSLPKFRFDAPVGLKEILSGLGMTDAFSSAADFTGISDGDLVITDVLHKGFVGIDENGTEAAAATAVIIGDTAAPEPKTLAVDKPFLFFIRDLPTGEILFVGRVVDPR